MQKRPAPPLLLFSFVVGCWQQHMLISAWIVVPLMILWVLLYQIMKIIPSYVHVLVVQHTKVPI